MAAQEWHAGLEEACTAYFTHRDAEGMVAQLQKLQKSMDAGPQTMREISFQVSERESHRESTGSLPPCLPACPSACPSVREMN